MNCSPAEWFSPDLKSVVQTASISLSFLMIFVAVQSLVLAHLGTPGLFLYFSGVCGLNTIFIAVCVPETGGEMYSHRHT